MSKNFKKLYLLFSVIILLISNFLIIKMQVNKYDEIKSTSYSSVASNFGKNIAFPVKIGDNLTVIEQASSFLSFLPKGVIIIQKSGNEEIVIDPQNQRLKSCKNSENISELFYNKKSVGRLIYCYQGNVNYIQKIDFIENILFSLVLFILLLTLFWNVQKRAEYLSEINIFSKQIAHDIRSPLEALKSVANSIDGLDYSTKKIITNSVSRISDIANGLLKASQDNHDELEVGNFRILLEDIVADKKFEKDAHIIYKPDSRYKDTFIKGAENKLYRAISNIINNAIEAQDEKPRVDIIVKSDTSGVHCIITDTGKGMSEQMIKQALEGGVTTKEKGNGLGLSYANKVIKEHGGYLKVESTKDHGTTVVITIPKIKEPNWFTDEIKIDANIEQIICVDDDPSFLELYREKLGKLKPKLTCLNEKSLNQLSKDDKTLFLVDFDLGLKETGLDIILKNELKNVILVTSMHQDEKIQKQCIENGIKILPKQVFNNALVSTSDESTNNTEKLSSQDEFILIDDDELMHMSWKMAAEEKNKKVHCYYSIDSFLKESENYSKDIPIYVDSNLSNDIKGEVESEKIYNNGFEHIYLATGYSASDIEKPNWIIKIVGKRPEFN